MYFDLIHASMYRLVLDAFKKVEPTRKCFRLIGGVLVERTVEEIKPSLDENLVNVCDTRFEVLFVNRFIKQYPIWRKV